MDTNIKIDVEKIQNQVAQEIYAEQKYSRENSAKLRAIEQRVPTYDDFRQMVLASHLKPLDKGESLTNNVSRQNIVWNSVSTSGTNQSKLDLNLNDKDLFVANLMNLQPKTNLEFVKIWRKIEDYNQNDETKWNFLSKFEHDAIFKIFSTEINADMLSKFIVLFDSRMKIEEINNKDVDLIFNLLKCFTKCNRFKLNKMFLNNKDIELCKKLFDNIEKRNLIDVNDLKNVKTEYY